MSVRHVSDFPVITLKIKEFTMGNDKKMMCFSRVDTDSAVVLPEYTESYTPGNNAQFVKWGPGNTFPNELQEAVKNSVTASSVIGGTVELFKGLDITLEMRTPGLTVDHMNRDDESMMDILEQCVRDYVTYGGYAIQVIYNKLGDIAEIYNIPMEFLRMNEDRTKFWFSKRWSKYSNKAITYPSFNERDKEPSCIMLYTNAGRRQIYPISPLTPAISDIISEGLSSKYVMKTLESGISANFIVSLPNSQNLTDEQKQDIEDGIRAKFCGLENRGEFMLYFNNGEQGLEVEKIDTDDSNEIFDSISQAASLKIFKALHATPQLFGDTTQSTGFNEQEYEQSFRIYKKMTLKPMCETLERTFNKVFGPDTLKINAD